MFSRESWCLVSISRGGNARFPPTDAHGQKWWRHFFEKFRQNAQILKSLVSVSVSNFKSRVSVSEILMKSRSRSCLEILTRSRSRRLRSRLHHCLCCQITFLLLSKELFCCFSGNRYFLHTFCPFKDILLFCGYWNFTSYLLWILYLVV